MEGSRCSEVDIYKDTRYRADDAVNPTNAVTSCNRMSGAMQEGAYAAFGFPTGTVLTEAICNSFYKDVGTGAFPALASVRPCFWDDVNFGTGDEFPEKDDRCRTTPVGQIACSPSPPPPQPPPSPPPTPPQPGVPPIDDDAWCFEVSSETVVDKNGYDICGAGFVIDSVDMCERAAYVLSTLANAASATQPLNSQSYNDPPGVTGLWPDSCFVRSDQLNAGSGLYNRMWYSEINNNVAAGGYNALARRVCKKYCEP